MVMRVGDGEGSRVGVGWILYFLLFGCRGVGWVVWILVFFYLDFGV